MKRGFSVGVHKYTGLSVGMVTTVPHMQRKGCGRRLMESIEEHARNENIDFIYLAGIPGFYEKLGYTGFAPKSKIIFRREDLGIGRGSVISAADKDRDVIKDMYYTYREHASGYSLRSEACWTDLFENLSESFLFFKPMVVLDNDLKPLAYFCSTPGKEGLIREFVTWPDTSCAVKALEIIATNKNYLKEGGLEIFAPAHGPLWLAAAHVIGGDYRCYLRPKSSNMIKWLSNRKRPEELESAFILQGDLL
jgi:predicted acetyltransferase